MSSLSLTLSLSLSLSLCLSLSLSLYRYRCLLVVYSLGFTAALSLMIMLLSLIQIFESSNRIIAYRSTLFLQSFLLVSLFIVLLLVNSVLGTAVNTELLAQR
jgi:hypothetical protein